MKEARHKRPHIVWFCLHEMSKIGKFIEMERLVIARGWWLRGWGVTANEYRFFVKWWKCPGISADGYIILLNILKTTPVLLPGKSHGRRSLVGCSPRGREESDSTERLHVDFSLSCIGEGNGNPFQCSCLENPRDRGAWWAAIYGVTQSQTRLKWLSRADTKNLWIMHLVWLYFINV